MPRTIRYIRDPASGLEAVFCLGSGIAYPLHSHVSVYTAGLVLSGAVQLTAGPAQRVLRQGEGFLLPPDLPHSIRPLGQYSLLSLCVPRALARPEAAATLRQGIGRLLGGGPEALFAPENALSGPQSRAGLAALLARLPAAAGTLRKADPPVEALRRQLEQRPEQKLSLDEMARAACLSKYHLIRVFRRQTGLTPHQFQLQNRVRRAQRLLAAGPDALPAAEAALAAGFCDQSHLVRCFERLVGLSPRAYRAACVCLQSGPPKAAVR